MSLSHVYIVLEPVGSAHLTFNDDRYYEFMCFDVPKVVRSPGYDHRHDEESRNGRDIKIDIGSLCLDIGMIPDEFGHFPEYREVTGPPWGVNGPYWALVGERRRRPGGRCPPKPNSNWVGGRPPFLPSLSLFLLLLLQLGKGG